MKKTKRLWSWALAGALAVSNLSVVVAPMSSIIVQAADLTGGSLVSGENINLAGAAKQTLNLTLEAAATTSTNSLAAVGATNGAYTISLNNNIPADAFTIDASGATATEGDGSSAKAKVTGLKVNVDITKLSGLSNGDNFIMTVKLTGANDTLVGSGTISVVDTYSASDNMEIAFREDSNDADGYDGKADGTYSLVVDDNTNKYDSTDTANSPIIRLGAVQNGKVKPITSGIAALATAAANDLYLYATSKNESIAKIATTANQDVADGVRIYGVKNGTANVEVQLMKYTNSGASADPTKDTLIMRTVIPVAVTGKIATITVYDKDNKEVAGTTTLDEKTPSVTYKAGVAPAVAGFDSDAGVIWVSNDPDYVDVSQNGMEATITAIGNKTGCTVYAIAGDDIAYLTAYEKAIDAGKTVEEAEMAGIAARTLATTTTLAVDTEAVALSIYPTDKATGKEISQLAFLVDGTATTISADSNDAKFTGNIGSDKTAGQTSMKLTFASDNDKVAAVDANGKVTPVAAGNATITITGTYKVATVNGLEEKTVETTLPVVVVDPEAQEEAKKEAIDAADKAADKAVSSPTAENIQAAKDAVAAAEAAGATADELKAATDKIAKAEEAKAKADEEAKKAEEEAKKKAEEEQKKQEEAKKAAETAADGSKANVPAPVNTELKDAAGKATGFKVTDATAGQATAEFVAPADKDATNVTVPDTIKDLSGNEYKVTSIASGAFKDSKAKTVTIGKNIKSIDKNAFKDSDIKTVKVKGTKLSKKMAKAFNKLKKGAKVKVSGSNKKKNKKYLNALKNVKNGKIKVK